MVYESTDWKDRIVQNPLTYDVQNNPDGSITLVPKPGTITQPGTPINATNLNNLEKQYDEVMKEYTRVPGYGATTGSANAYVLTLNPAPTSYVDGLAVVIKLHVDSNASSTLDVNGLGAKALKSANGNDVMALKSGGVYTFRYNATTGNFILQGEGVDVVPLITAVHGILSS